MRTGAARRLEAVLALVALGTVAGCGLKGGLTMPEPATNVVVRGPGGAVAGGTEAAPGTTPPADTATQDAAGKAATTTTKAPKVDRMPPPPLPGGNPGSAHGG